MFHVNTDNPIIQWLIENLGYLPLIRLKDFILFGSGVAIGGLILVILISRFFYRVQRVENLGSVTSVRFKRNGKMFYFTQIKTFYEAMEFLTQMAVMPSNRKRDYTVADERRTKILINTLLTIGFIMVLISILFILNPLVSADGSAPM